MDLDGITARTTSLAEQAGKSALHAAWTAVALRPRTATVTALGLILAAFFAGVAVGGSF